MAAIIDLKHVRANLSSFEVEVWVLLQPPQV